MKTLSYECACENGSKLDSVDHGLEKKIVSSVLRMEAAVWLHEKNFANSRDKPQAMMNRQTRMTENIPRTFSTKLRSESLEDAAVTWDSLLHVGDQSFKSGLLYEQHC